MRSPLTIFERFRIAIAIIGFCVSFAAWWMVSFVATWFSAFVLIAIAVLALIVSILAIGRTEYRKGAPTNTQLQKTVPAILEVIEKTKAPH